MCRGSSPRQRAQDEVVVAVEDHRRIVRARSVTLRAWPNSRCAWSSPKTTISLAELIDSILDEDERFTVVGRASNGDEAVELAGRARVPTSSSMDIAMPACDGIEATRMIHALDAGQHVVIYTGSDEYADVARAEDAGAAGFLHKDALTSELPDALYVLHRTTARS